MSIFFLILFYREKISKENIRLKDVNFELYRNKVKPETIFFRLGTFGRKTFLMRKEKLKTSDADVLFYISKHFLSETRAILCT